MKNFPFYKDGREFWYSRSNVCSCYVLAKMNGTYYVLAAQRGPNQTSPYQWNVPGGFLDHGETLAHCAAREAYEETGVEVNESRLTLFHIRDTPKGNLQHVVFSYYIFLGDLHHLPQTTRDHNEPGETAYVGWIPVEKVRNWDGSNSWLSGHRERILKVHDEIINPKLTFIQKIKKFFK